MTGLLADGFLLALRLVLPGLVWSRQAEQDEQTRLMENTAGILLAGFLANILPALALASVNAWTVGNDWIAWVLITAAGAINALVRGNVVARLRRSALPVLASTAGLLVLGLLPPRSEWLAGGWDPGVYQNNAIALAERHGFAPWADSVFARMTPEQRLLVTEAEGDYREAFPGIPLNMEDGSIPFYFFHLSPLTGAWCYRLGGTSFLFNAPVILAWLGFVAFAALARAIVPGAGWRWCALFWLVAPVWWYQQALPTSEMLYLFLMLGGLWAFHECVEQGVRYPWAAAAAFFAATINHFNFPVIGGSLLAALAWSGIFRKKPAARPGALLCLAAIAAGMWWDVHFASVTIERIDAKDDALKQVMIAFVMLAFSLLPASLLSRLRMDAPRLRPWFRFAPVLAVLIVAAVLMVYLIPNGLIVRGRHLFVFQGTIPLMLALAGMLLLLLRRRAEAPGLFWLGGAASALLVFLLSNPGIYQIYPWALRRYVPVLLLVMAIGQGYAVWSLWQAGGRAGALAKALAVIAGGWAICAGAERSHIAAGVGDYRGLAPVLQEMSKQIRPEDIVVADDPRWGTPLLMAYQRQVISGRPLWNSKDPDFHARYASMLNELAAAQGGRILWLTSTGRGLTLYSVPPQTDPAIFSKKFDYKTVIHSARGKGFAMTAHTRELSLWPARAF